MRSVRSVSTSFDGYTRGVRHAILIALVVAACGGITACGGKEPVSRIPKKPNNELIVGDFERHAPGTTAYRFGNDGSFFAAKTKAELERTPHLSEDTYTVDQDKLTFTAVRGDCANQAGSYKVVLSKVGIRVVEKIEDECEARTHLVGQTLWRIK